MADAEGSWEVDEPTEVPRGQLRMLGRHRPRMLEERRTGKREEEDGA